MAATHKQLILVVDDKEINRLMLKEMLSDVYDVVEASNGKEALEQLDKYNTSIKAVLLDLVMPVMDGHMFLMEVRKTKYAEIPTIVLTGTNDPEIEEAALKEGASDLSPSRISQQC